MRKTGKFCSIPLKRGKLVKMISFLKFEGVFLRKNTESRAKYLLYKNITGNFVKKGYRLSNCVSNVILQPCCTFQTLHSLTNI